MLTSSGAGRCFRGSNCRFLHLDNANGMSADQGGSRYDRGGGRGSQGGRREDSEESDRWERGSSRGGRGRTSGRGRRPWEASNDRDEDYEEERRKPSEERRKPWEERRKPSEERRKPWEERRKPSEERRKPSEERRKPSEERERQRPDGTPVRDNDGEKASQRREEEIDEKPQPLESLAAGSPATTHQSNFSSFPPPPPLPSSSSITSFPDFPPPPPDLPQLHSTFTPNLTNLASAASQPATPLSQGFSAPPLASQQPPYNVNLPGQGYTPTMMIHAAFSGNPPPPQGAYPNRLPAMQLQPTYMVTSPQQPGYPPVSQVSSGHSTVVVRPVPLGCPPQIRVQSLPAPTRPESAWPMSFSMQPVQVNPSSYCIKICFHLLSTNKSVCQELSELEVPGPMVSC